MNPPIQSQPSTSAMPPQSIQTHPTLPLLTPTKPHAFARPQKLINEGTDVSAFLVSKAYKHIVTFIMQLNRAVVPTLYSNTNDNSKASGLQTWEIKSESQEEAGWSETTRNLRSLITVLDGLIDECPPDPGPRRFGNTAFRTWYARVEKEAPALLAKYLPDQVVLFHTDVASREERNGKEDGGAPDAVEELTPYFLGGWGSAQRLDYGTGHELSFLAFLGGVWMLGGFWSDGDETAGGEKEREIVLGVVEPLVFYFD